MRHLLAVGTLVSALVAASCGGDSGTSASSSAASVASSAASNVPDGFTVDLSEQNGSGESGTATLTPVGADSMKVVLNVTGGGAAAQPAHLHQGSCDELGSIAFPLNDVVNGQSETTIKVSYTALVSYAAAGGIAINVHKSAAEIKTYVACGDIVSSP
jgi:hypothetical protein